MNKLAAGFYNELTKEGWASLVARALPMLARVGGAAKTVGTSVAVDKAVSGVSHSLSGSGTKPAPARANAAPGTDAAKPY